VAFATVRGVRRARAKDYIAHRRCMLHVLAQLSVAVTSRTLLYLLDAVGIDPDPAYLFALWAPVLASSGFVEVCLVRRPHRRSSAEARGQVLRHAASNGVILGGRAVRKHAQAVGLVPEQRHPLAAQGEVPVDPV